MSLFTPKTVALLDGAEVLLRSPVEDEAGQLLEYLDAVRHETNGIMYSPTDELPSLDEERQWIRSHSDNENAVNIAAVADGVIVGLAGVHPIKFTRQRHVGGLGISLRQAWCDRGLGTVMMRELIDWSRNRKGLELLTLCVFDSNPRAEAVYRKAGFVEDGRLPRRAKVNGAYVGLIEMSLWLDKAGSMS